MGASRYMAVADHETYKAGTFITGTEYERLGEPDAFQPADFPEDVARLRDEHGLNEQSAEAESPSYVDELEGKTVEELRELATERNIEGRSSMNKQQLIDALREG
jgi:hypothetical protein